MSEERGEKAEGRILLRGAFFICSAVGIAFVLAYGFMTTGIALLEAIAFLTIAGLTVTAVGLVLSSLLVNAHAECPLRY